MYQPLPHVDLLHIAELGVSGDSSEVTFIESVSLKPHAFDSESLEEPRGVCDFPAPKKVNQLRGEFGPRYYNKITVGQQLAQISNVSLKNIV